MPRGENRPSVLLSNDENEQVFSLIGPKCQSLITTVVQLFTTEGPAHSEWKKKDTGVLCLIKDNGKRSYFFRIYCLYRKAMIWEHEVYLQIEYKSPRPYLHTFEAEDYMTAFNFASESEASALRNILIEKIELRKKRREDRKHRSMQAVRANSTSSYGSTLSINSRMNGAHPAPPAPLPPAPLTPAPVPTPLPVSLPSSKSNTLSNYTLKSSSKKPKARKLTKADIGMPQDFKHVSHVGWDANKGFDVDLPEEEMKSFFSKAGISDKQLQDHATREFIYDFINSHGGVDAVKEELHDTPKTKATRGPAPPPAPPVPARVPHSQQAPAPPSRAPPPPPARAVPPPPPPPPLSAPRNPPPPRPLQPPVTAPPSVPPPPPPSSAPPPPPAPAAPPAPPPPPMPVDAGPPDARSALMESIRSGNKTLKRVEVGSKNSLNEDNRSNLLSEIRQGINLRSVQVRRSSSTTGEESEFGPETCGLAGALARALRDRARVIQSSDSEESDNEDSDEWE